MREPSSHVMSAIQGDRYVPDASERAQWSVFEAWLNTQMPKGSGHKKVTRPWAGKKPDYSTKTAAAVTPESVARRQKLAAMF